MAFKQYLNSVLMTIHDCRFIWGDNSFNLQVRLKLIKPHLFGMNQEIVGMYAQREIIRLKKEYVRTAFKTAFKGVFKKVVSFLEKGSMLFEKR